MLPLDRRTVIFGGLASCVSLTSFPTVAARPDPYRRLNGRWDPEAKRFDWERINVDPFGGQPLADALTLFGIPTAHQAVIIPQIEVRPGVYTEPNQGVQEIHEGHFYAAMVSGGIRTPEPWVTPSVAPHPDESWQSTKIDVWVIHVGNDRFVFGRPLACNNWIVISTTSKDFQCRCEPERGDICS